MKPSTTTNVGTCYICQQTFEQRAMARHVAKCLTQPAGLNSKTDDIFLLKLSSGTSFWLYIEICANAYLKDLDFFLRKIWLECCGHMSVFTIQGKEYGSPHLRQPLAQVFTPGTTFAYQYDMGTTTEVEGKMIAAYQGQLSETIHLVARNNIPAFTCSTCRAKPETICSVCFDFCCAQCRKKHTCDDDEWMLPIVNSPRMGVCGYTGTE